MYSIKVKDKNEWKLVGNDKGQPLVYDTNEKAQKAMGKINKKREPKLVGSIPVVVVK